MGSFGGLNKAEAAAKAEKDAKETILNTQSDKAGGESGEHSDKVEQNETNAQINADVPGENPNDKLVQGIHNDRVTAAVKPDGKAGQQETMQISTANTVNDANQAEVKQMDTLGEGLGGADIVQSEEGVQSDSGKFYSVLPTKEWQIGRFQFTNGQLHLVDDDDISEFEKIIDHPKFPMTDRVKIKTIDFDLANKIAANQSIVAQRGYDSGQNSQFEQLKKEFPKVGTGDMGTKESGQG